MRCIAVQRAVAGSIAALADFTPSRCQKDVIMHWAKSSRRFSLGFSVMLAVILVSYPLMAATLQFKLPKRGLPGRREGGGTRGAQLTALLPRTNLGLTTAAYPRFFWAMPDQFPAEVAEFTLFEGDSQQPDRQLIYRTTFRVTGNAGIASLALPSDAAIPPLEVGKDYHWTVKIATSLEKLASPQSQRVDGWVERVQPPAEFAAQLQRAATPLDRASLYAANGYWFDTVSLLAELRCQQPNNPTVVTTWTNLLRSVQLTPVARKPLLRQCPANP